MALFSNYIKFKLRHSILFYLLSIVEWLVLILIVLFDVINKETLFIGFVTAVSIGICGNIITGGYQEVKNVKSSVS